jgi:hypothetical protein
MKKTNRRKHVSAKKMSARERGIFVDKKPSAAGGLQVSKAGCCFWTNDVLCTHSEEPASGYLDRCFACSTYKRVYAEMEDEDEKVDAEIEEAHRTGVHP